MTIKSLSIHFFKTRYRSLITIRDLNIRIISLIGLFVLILYIFITFFVIKNKIVNIKDLNEYSQIFQLTSYILLMFSLMRFKNSQKEYYLIRYFPISFSKFILTEMYITACIYSSFAGFIVLPWILWTVIFTGITIIKLFMIIIFSLLWFYPFIILAFIISLLMFHYKSFYRKFRKILKLSLIALILLFAVFFQMNLPNILSFGSNIYMSIFKNVIDEKFIFTDFLYPFCLLIIFLIILHIIIYVISRKISIIESIKD